MLRKSMACLVPFLLLAGCSTAQDETTDTEQASDVLEGIPESASGRFIITLKHDGSGTIDEKTIEAAVASLRESGVTSVEHFEGLPTVIAECDRDAVERLVELGLVESVQADQLSEPN